MILVVYIAMKTQDIERANKMKREKTEILCNECGKRFKRTIGINTFEIKCPKCGGYDTEPA